MPWISGQSAPGRRHGKAVASKAAPIIWYVAAVLGPELLHGLSRAGDQIQSLSRVRQLC
jgi:hypothetical protein